MLEEVKAAETYISDFGKGIQSFQEIAGERSDQGYIIYAGEREFSTR